MYWLQFHGATADGVLCSDQLTERLPSIEAAVTKALKLADTTQFYWGKATGFRIRNRAMTIVCEGPLFGVRSLNWKIGRNFSTIGHLSKI